MNMEDPRGQVLQQILKKEGRLKKYEKNSLTCTERSQLLLTYSWRGVGINRPGKLRSTTKRNKWDFRLWRITTVILRGKS
jgi:hypothetical protein